MVSPDVYGGRMHHNKRFPVGVVSELIRQHPKLRGVSPSLTPYNPRLLLFLEQVFQQFCIARVLERLSPGEKSEPFFGRNHDVAVYREDVLSSTSEIQSCSGVFMLHTSTSCWKISHLHRL